MQRSYKAKSYGLQAVRGVNHVAQPCGTAGSTDRANNKISYGVCHKIAQNVEPKNAKAPMAKGY